MSLGGGGGARSLKGGAQGGRDPLGFGPGRGEIPRDLAPGGGRYHGGGGGAKSLGHRYSVFTFYLLFENRHQ